MTDISTMSLADLIRSLEQHWQPDADTFLLPKSVGTSSLTYYAPRWLTPSFATGWASHASVAVSYAKHPNGVVRIEGLATKTTGDMTTGETIFTLPVNMRPSVAKRFATTLNDTSAVNVCVTPVGNVVVFGGSALTGSRSGFLPLDGVSFWAEG